MAPQSLPRVHGWTLSACAAAYLVAAMLGLATRTDYTPIALWWPAAGVAVCWLLICTSRRQRLVAYGWIAAVLSVQAWTVFGQAGPAALIALTHVTMAAITTAGTRLHRTVQPSLDSLASTQGLARVCAAAAVAAVITAPGAYVAIGWATGAWSPDTLWAWLGRNTVATVVVVLTVSVLYARQLDSDPQARRVTTAPRPGAVIELVVVAAVSGLVTAVIFAGNQVLPVAFVLTAVMAWLGSRFSPWVVALGINGVSATVITLTTSGRGVFAAIEDPLLRALVAQLFIVVCFGLGLLLAFGDQDRRRLLRAVLASEGEARNQARLLQAVTDSMTDGLVVAAASGDLILSNATGAVLVGNQDVLSFDEPARHGFFNLDGTPVAPQSGLHRRAVAGDPIHGEPLLHVSDATGKRTIQSVNSSPLDGWSGHESVTVFLLHDVTDVHLHLQQVQGFAGMVAHDLKAPLSVVSGWSQLLDEELDDLGPAAAEAATMLARIRTATGRMATLISELLLYTQAQSAALNNSDIDLGVLIDEIADELPAGREAVISHGDLPAVVGDAVLLRQVFVNLIGNSLKYVAPGTRPVIEIHGTRHDNGDWVEVTMSDNGIGIPDGQRDRVFDPFTRLHASYAGTGLGLSICQTVAARHGGFITAGPGSAGGTAMTIRLPAVASDGPAAGAGPIAVAGPATGRTDESVPDVEHPLVDELVHAQRPELPTEARALDPAERDLGALTGG